MAKAGMNMDNPPWRADSKRQLSFSSDRGADDAEAKRQCRPDTTSQHEAEIFGSETDPNGETDLLFFAPMTEHSGVGSVEDMGIGKSLNIDSYSGCQCSNYPLAQTVIPTQCRLRQLWMSHPMTPALEL